MVAQTTIDPGRIAISLDYVARELDFLAEVEGESEETQLAYMLEWPDLMARLQSLERAYRSGRMTSEQAERYRELLGKLSEALPIIERLGLTRPPVSLQP
ncbi:hypothetical protein HRbin26_00943 [bacterium HR26]|nr:hypothetical protein HRbin26_00943 [bacterium HR26]